jgi:hypothetical protein
VGRLKFVAPSWSCERVRRIEARASQLAMCTVQTAIRRNDRRWQGVPRGTAVRIGGVTVEMPWGGRTEIRT